jgi:hypothetical protein
MELRWQLPQRKPNETRGNKGRGCGVQLRRMLVTAFIEVAGTGHGAWRGELLSLDLGLISASKRGTLSDGTDSWTTDAPCRAKGLIPRSAQMRTEEGQKGI